MCVLIVSPIAPPSMHIPSSHLSVYLHVRRAHRTLEQTRTFHSLVGVSVDVKFDIDVETSYLFHLYERKDVCTVLLANNERGPD